MYGQMFIYAYFDTRAKGLEILTASGSSCPGPLSKVFETLTPGSTACANLTTSLGKAKVKLPCSLTYVRSRLSYWNARQARYAPSCAVYPTTAQEVSTILRTVRAAKSRFAIKTAGHCPNDLFSSVDAGVLIDLNRMTARAYDHTTTIATYGPGGTFGDIYKYLQPFNRTVVGARLAPIGTGLALGGGLSYLSSRYGMACDSFRELEIVLPNGKIVKASPKENSDLFYACKGGGGNAYGVVTKYVVQTVPSGTFYAGNLMWGAKDGKAVLEAIRNFAVHNKDPKAAILGTIQKLGMSMGGLIPRETVMMFLVYDGPDAGKTFENFTKIPAKINTLKKRTYQGVVNMPIPNGVHLGRGNNIFRVQVHRVDDKEYMQAFDVWSKWCDDNKGSYVLSSIDYQPIQRSLTDASKAQNGGNAMQMPDGPWFWLNFLLTTPRNISQAKYDAVQASFKNMVNSVPNAKGLPLFINDAATYSRLQSIKKKYDPDNFFAKYTGGWSFA
ncbi:FAD-binding domain-containing protein [Myriangium duriaei CBS 260.36]|uniref:FAD-binding domain-containing protein n=1 Tax=Myriangium duriaei CBS 260.36 TaxID=1168546 RepID=A0A9P4MMQ0_9PEZI|nr:FAD-binding domain-containing protein [Myriangium duriaei CBS 260.36]